MSTTSEQTLENKNDAPPKSQGFLGFVERAGNVLPDPFWLFVILAGLVAISSWLGSKAGMIAINPQDNSPVAVTNLLTKDGISKMLTEAVNNFVAFPPL